MNTVPLRHLAQVLSSSVDKKSHESEVPVRLCNYMDVYRNDRVNPGMDLMAATATTDEVERFRLLQGDSVITKDSEDPNDIGISAFVDATAEDFICGYHLAILRPGDRLVPRFLNWSVRGRPVLGHWSNQASGMTRYGLGLDGIKSAPIGLFDLDEQTRIAEFLDDWVARIDRVIDARREQSRLATLMYESWLDELMASFAQFPMRRFMRRIEQGWSPVAESVPALEGEPGVLKLGAVRGGDFRPAENKAFLPGDKPREEYRIREGDLLITRANTPALVGDAAVVKEIGDDHLYLSDLIYRVELPGYDVHLASAALRTSKVRQLIAVVARGTSGSMPKLRGEDLASLPLPMVPDSHRQRLGARDREQRARRDSQIESLTRSIDLLAKYKTSLITSAVTGELDVTTAGSGIPA